MLMSTMTMERMTEMRRERRKRGTAWTTARHPPC